MKSQNTKYFITFFSFLAGSILERKISCGKWAQHEMGMASKSTMPPLPSKPCRRLLVFTLAWTCLCFLFFRVYYNQGLDGTIGTGGHLSPDSSLNTRELLQVSKQIPKSLDRFSIKFVLKCVLYQTLDVQTLKHRIGRVWLKFDDT